MRDLESSGKMDYFSYLAQWSLYLLTLNTTSLIYTSNELQSYWENDSAMYLNT